MTNEVIKIKEGVNYLNEVMAELPKNCLFDKGKVGCGGTTIALGDVNHTVIAVPFVSLIENKIAQVSGVLGVYGGVQDEEIMAYIHDEEIEVKKIMVTYDSIWRVMEFIEPQDYNLLIDEYHLLFTQYSFRSEAIQKVLGAYSQFKAFTFMTATVLEEEFILDELKHLPVVTCDWYNVKETTVNNIYCPKIVDAAVVDIINGFLNETNNGNAYFFVNSVEFIKAMIKACDLDESNCRVIYSKSNSTNVGIPNGLTTDAPKKINFLTSTVFEGSDIYDENGHIIIVSDGRKDHTLTDISTSLQQIAGRIRDTVYAKNIYHIYSKTRYKNDLTYEQYKQWCEEALEETKAALISLNSLPDGAKSKIETNDAYMVKLPDNSFKFDPNRVKIDLYYFKVVRCMYRLRVNVGNELKSEGFAVNEYTTKMDYIPTEKAIKKNGFEEITELVHQTGGMLSSYYEEATSKYDFFSDAYHKLGYKRMKELKFKVSNIKREVVKYSQASELNKVIKHLKTYRPFDNGSFITAKEAKVLISEAHGALGMEKTANIKDYFEVKDTRKRIEGEVVRGYNIIFPKAILS